MKKTRWAHTLVVFIVALAVRAAITVWAHDRFPPAADGVFYERFADRLAHGLGYTTAWPDGVVTYAAHYPVGYPVLLSVVYRLFGRSMAAAMGLNALIGAMAAACAHRIALRETPPTLALCAGLAIALHPTLVLYTPALMTEGVTAALVVIAAACLPARQRSPRWYWPRVVAAGAMFGTATLVRPQIIVLAPVLAWVFTRRARVAGIVLAAAIAAVAPWTARNCVRMHRCALVSVNGGWNLLIGTQTTTGAWTELATPPECLTVWDEAEKDTCFEHAAQRAIREAPLAWLAKVPRKLGTTFDFFVAGPVYLARSNPAEMPYKRLARLVVLDVLASRALLVAALIATMPIWRLLKKGVTPPRARVIPGARILLALLAIVAAGTHPCWLAYLLLGSLCLVRQKDDRRSDVRLAAGIIILATMATHAVFFGSGRYGLLVVPWVTLVAFACVRPKALSTSPMSTPGR